jgi:hypothetical protein
MSSTPYRNGLSERASGGIREGKKGERMLLVGPFAVLGLTS